MPKPRPPHVYAERIRACLPRTLKELREAAGLTRYGLEQTSGISREYIGRLERGKANPSLPVLAQLCYGMGLTLEELITRVEEKGGRFRGGGGRQL